MPLAKHDGFGAAILDGGDERHRRARRPSPNLAMSDVLAVESAKAS
jgi:hypothetical protein